MTTPWTDVAAFVIGAGATFGCGLLVQPAIQKSTSGIRRLPSPDEGLEQAGQEEDTAALWRDLVQGPRNAAVTAPSEEEPGGGSRTGGSWIGRLERFVFFAVFVSGHEWVGVSYLALKVATKWQSWTNIVRLADGGEQRDDIPGLRRLRARSYASSWLTTRFLVGTLANLLAGFAGYGCFWGVAVVLNAWC